MVRTGFVMVEIESRSVLQEDEGESCHENTVTATINDVISRGVTMGKTAANHVKEFDEKHGLSATAVATASSVDQKLGIAEKFNAGALAINQQLRAVDEKFQLSEKTKSALAVAEERVNVASSAITKNVLTGASWITGALNKVVKAADEAVKKAKDRATRENVSDGVSEPHQGGYARVNSAEAAADSVHAAPPRLYVYNPHGALLRVVGT